MALYTVGHSDHEWETFLPLLQGSSISIVVDVRSHPWSAWRPIYNKPSLRAALATVGIQYAWFPALGGRPSDPMCLDEKGRAAYHLMIQQPQTIADIQRLISGSEDYNIAMLCSCGDPAVCHRHRMLYPMCVDRDVDMLHIRKDATIINASELGDPRPAQAELGKADQLQWWSLKPVIDVQKSGSS